MDAVCTMKIEEKRMDNFQGHLGVMYGAPIACVAAQQKGYVALISLQYKSDIVTVLTYNTTTVIIGYCDTGIA